MGGERKTYGGKLSMITQLGEAIGCSGTTLTVLG